MLEHLQRHWANLAPHTSAGTPSQCPGASGQSSIFCSKITVTPTSSLCVRHFIEQLTCTQTGDSANELRPEERDTRGYARWSGACTRRWQPPCSSRRRHGCELWPPRQTRRCVHVNSDAGARVSSGSDASTLCATSTHSTAAGSSTHASSEGCRLGAL